MVARFDAARDTFLAAFAQAPDEALPYRPLARTMPWASCRIHLQDSMNHYLDVYQRVTAANYGPVDLGADPAHRRSRRPRSTSDSTTTKPTGADRAAMLADLDATQRRVTERFPALDDATFTRQAAVVYRLAPIPIPPRSPISSAG